jgi:hypothetical protein
MNTISFAIALIAIIFGAQLLAQAQKENLSSLYKYLSWFVIVSGFFLMMYVSAWGLYHMAERRHGGIMQKEMRTGRGDDMGRMGGGPMWMRHHKRDNMNCCNNCCDGMMNYGGNNNCCGGMMDCGGNNGCADGMMNCPDGGKGAMGAGCLMMGKMKDKVVDSTKTKEEK